MAEWLRRLPRKQIPSGASVRIALVSFFCFVSFCASSDRLDTYIPLVECCVGYQLGRSVDQGLDHGSCASADLENGLATKPQG